MKKKLIYLLIILFGLNYPMCELEDKRTEATGIKVTNKISLFKKSKWTKPLDTNESIRRYKQEPVSIAMSIYQTLNDFGIEIITIETPTRLYEVTIKLKSNEMIENNHVGHEWAYEFEVGKIPIKINEECSIIVHPNQYFKVSSTIIEREEKEENDDIGIDIVKIDYSDLEEGFFSLTKNISVRENRGRFSGNRAYFEVKYELTVVAL